MVLFLPSRDEVECVRARLCRFGCKKNQKRVINVKYISMKTLTIRKNRNTNFVAWGAEVLSEKKSKFKWLTN